MMTRLFCGIQWQAIRIKKNKASFEKKVLFLCLEQLILNAYAGVKKKDMRKVCTKRGMLIPQCTA